VQTTGLGAAMQPLAACTIRRTLVPTLQRGNAWRTLRVPGSGAKMHSTQSARRCSDPGASEPVTGAPEGRHDGTNV